MPKVKISPLPRACHHRSQVKSRFLGEQTDEAALTGPKLSQIVPLTLYVPYSLLKDVTLVRIAFMSEAVKQMEIGSIGFNEMFFVKEPNEEPELSALREASAGEASLIFAVDSTGIWAPAVTCDDS